MQFVSGFLWGSGLSLGICVGLVAWVFLRTMANKICGIADDWYRLQQYNKASLAALVARNELTKVTNEHLKNLEAHFAPSIRSTEPYSYPERGDGISNA